MQMMHTNESIMQNTTPSRMTARKVNHDRSASESDTKEKNADSHQTNRFVNNESIAINRSMDTCVTSVLPDSLLSKYSSNDAEVELIERLFRMTASISFVVWILLMCIVISVVPFENFERLEGIEKQAATVAFSILFVSCVGRLLPSLYRTLGKPSSGIIQGAFLVQLIAMTTDFIMAFFPCPIMIDKITGARVHLFRWCEWTPLAFTMTFMTEGMDMPDPKYGVATDILLAVAQGMSTLMGFLFPFCPGIVSWSILMVISWVLYSFIFIRLYYSRKKFLATERGTHVVEIEHYNRVRSSYLLLVSVTTIWTGFVFVYFLEALAPRFSEKGSVWQSPALSMVAECFMDVLSKVLYLYIIVDVHDSVFDDAGRAQRRLKELTNLMSVVWKNSSDVIIISVRGISGGVTTTVSPIYHKFVSRSANDENDNNGKDDDNQLGEKARKGGDDTIFSKSFVIEHEASELDQEISADKNKGSYRLATKIREVLPSKASIWPCISDDPHSDNTGSESQLGLLRTKSLISKAWKCSNTSGDEDGLFTHDLIRSDGSLLQCEAKVNLLEENILIIVVRDISERVMRFEAEKQSASESTARQKDAQANRFTKHEVKNGLLSSIALCDNLQEFLQQAASATASNEVNLNSTSSTSSSDPASCDRALSLTNYCSAKLCAFGLGSILHEVLDTILSDAMARDVVHEVYEPRIERVDIPSIVSKLPPGHDNSESTTEERFFFVSHPSPLPEFKLDPQLLKYIHRNAVTNACKYGKKSGVVRTEVHFNAKSMELRMDVINLPGEFHEELVELGDRATEAVFSQGRRLHSRYLENANYNHVLSSGDGAWIMRKCAKTLGGECTIRFEPQRTIFSLRCPAIPVQSIVTTKRKQSLHENPPIFKIPEGTWGIAIDDSKIQQKLLGRILGMVGVAEEFRILLGSNSSEIKTFVEYVVDLVGKHPEKHFLLIVDENLDIMDDESHHITVSGSLCIEKIRKMLKPSEERNVLALVRSANDSASDVAMYKSRAHGFFPKAPMKKEIVLEMLAPLWKQRFDGRMNTASHEN